MNIISKLLKTNFEKGRGGHIPMIIVEHIIGLPGITAESAYQHFSNPYSEVSAHYIIKRTGEIWQSVLDSDTAWANGSISYRNGVPLLPTNPIAQKCWQKGERINQISLSIENEGSENEDLTSEQYKANAELIKELSRKFNIPMDSTHICGHREIKKDKVCPGKISVGKILELANAPIIVKPDIPTPIFISTQITPKPTQMPMWMKFFLDRSKATLGAIFGDPIFGGIPRSSKWPKIRNDFIRQYPNCEACGVKAETVHHIIPYHKNPLLELDTSNLISLCDECHLVLAHLKSFQRFDSDIKEVTRLFKKKVENANINI